VSSPVGNGSTGPTAPDRAVLLDAHQLFGTLDTETVRAACLALAAEAGHRLQPAEQRDVGSQIRGGDSATVAVAATATTVNSRSPDGR
jgi:hypothetical protein